jgi:hypothetical protein
VTQVQRYGMEGKKVVHRESSATSNDELTFFPELLF